MTGIPADNARDVPDVALYSSPDLPGYLYCTSDQSDWSSSQKGSCGSSEFYDATSGYFTVAGGTSFAAPIFAGMVAIVNQKAGYTTGQGLLNPALYQLASNATTYASAFHDVTSGNNYCTAGTTYGYCSASGATEGYAAGTGYDLVTGLGSVDLSNLAAAWPSGTLTASSTSLSAASGTVAIGAGDAITVTVASKSGSVTTTPTGSISVTVDGVADPTPISLTSGSATYTFSPTATGSHLIAITYSGDTTYSTSAGSVTVAAVGGGTTATTTTLSASSTTPTVGTSVTLTATVAPSAATGTVVFSDGSIQLGTGTLSGGTATYTTTSLALGAHSITASYGGDSTYAAPSSTASALNVTVSVSTGTYSITATNITVNQGSAGTSTITVKPTGGYIGTVTIAPTNSDSNVSLCYTAATATVSSSASATGSLSIDTNLDDCGATNDASKGGAKRLTIAGRKCSWARRIPSLWGLRLWVLRESSSVCSMAAAPVPRLLLAAGSRRHRLDLTACGGGGGSGSSNGNYTTKGTYNITITGTDIAGNSASTTFSLKVQ